MSQSKEAEVGGTGDLEGSKAADNDDEEKERKETPPRRPRILKRKFSVDDDDIDSDFEIVSPPKKKRREDVFASHNNTNNCNQIESNEEEEEQAEEEEEDPEDTDDEYETDEENEEEQQEEEEEEEGEDSDDEYETDEDEPPKWSCNVIRNKLRRLTQTPGFKITHWLKENGGNSNSYGRFMRLKGTWNGTQNQTFSAATRYFKKLEKQKKKAAKKNKTKKTNKNKKTRAEKAAEIQEILDKIKSVEDEYDKESPIYDDCNDVRKKINAFLKRGIFTQSRFLKEIGNVGSNSYHAFMSLGPLKLSGARNVTYFRAYHWLEKLRIAEGVKKSKKRLQNETERPQGFPLRHDNGMRTIPDGFVPVIKGDKVVILRKEIYEWTQLQAWDVEFI